MTEPKQRRPGDLILDRYMPNASAEEREEARTNLKALAALIIETNRRLERELGDKEIRVNRIKDVESQAQA